MTIHPQYRLPFALAIALHLCLFLAFWFHAPSSNYRVAGPLADKTQIVQAHAVEDKPVMQQVAKVQKQVAAQQNMLAQQEQKAQEAQKAQEEQAAEKQVLHEKRVEQQQALALAHQTQVKEAALLAQQKALARQKKMAAQKQADDLKKAAAAKKHQLELKKQLAQKQRLQKLKALQQKILAQQMALDRKQLAADQSHSKEVQQTSNQMAGVIDQYKALILNKIGQYWLVPASADKNAQCIFAIHLAPTGAVLDVSLEKSSGDPALDNSARVAIVKASPLPVPKDPAAFDNFRELRLTVSPKNTIES